MTDHEKADMIARFQILHAPGLTVREVHALMETVDWDWYRAVTRAAYYRLGRSGSGKLPRG